MFGKFAQLLPGNRIASPVVWLLVPMAFGLLSLLIGQDANWDLQNYHLYNPYALLTGRVGVDLGPAGPQTYFNPLLDIPHYWMAMNLPPRAVGWVTGTLHGLNFLLLLGVVRRVLPVQTEKRTIFLLALSGCLGAVFISELGNSMGDNTTALFVLGAVLMVLHYRPIIEAGGAGAYWLCAGAGLVAGLGVGLKLTNAPYAVGICLALATLARPLANRVFLMFVFGMGVLVGISITAGYWFLTMWEHFGNPFFPMFNSVFKSDMAAAVSNADTRWLPRSPWEALLFPYVFTIWPERFGEVAMIQLLWPAVYTLSGIWLVRASLRLVRRTSCPLQTPVHADDSPARFLLVFLVASYIVWMAVFSIGRYSVVMEMLLPVVAWIVLHRLTTPVRAAKLASWLIVAAVLLSLIRFDTWGNARWGERSYSVRPPVMTQPRTATVLVLGAPIAWVLPYFPSELVFVSLGLFPESDAYRRRADSIIASRPGELFAILPANLDGRANAIRNVNEWARDKDIRRGDRSCSALTWALKRLSKYKLAVVAGFAPGAASDLCAFELPMVHRRDTVGENRQIAQSLSTSIASRGLSLDLGTCKTHFAYIGRKEFVYQFCGVLKNGRS